MMRSLFSAVSGLTNHKTAMDVIGNNISNVNTVGFKRSSVVFSDLFSQTMSAATAPTDTLGGKNPLQVGLGMSIMAIKTNITQGSAQSTNRAMDFSINGEGYFIVEGKDGLPYYTRNGSLQVDARGRLVSEEGDFILGRMATRPYINLPATPSPDALTGDVTYDSAPATDMGTITIDPMFYREYYIDENGYVKAKVYNTTGDPAAVPPIPDLPADINVGDEVFLGRVAMGTFINAAGLEKRGGSLMAQSANSGAVAFSFVNERSSGSLKGSTLEMSNVDLGTEMTDMIIMQRGFQANSRVITTSDSMLEELVNLKR